MVKAIKDDVWDEINKLIDGGIEKLSPEAKTFHPEHAEYGMFTESEAKQLNKIVDLVKNYLNRKAIKDDVWDEINKLIDGGIEKLSPEAKTFHPEHAEYGMFTESEAKQLNKIVDLVKNYRNLKAPSRPLCLAIFGAPGSGKSFLVNKFPELLKKQGGKSKLASLKEINLSQLSSVDLLGEALYKARKDSESEDKVPFIFFDEFDSKLDSAPWGWLRWFLAPMQDGVFIYKDKKEELKEGVYVFAGGTTCSFKDFGRSDPEAFSLAKGPDFISRLRGYLDLPGINAKQKQEYRRAALLNVFMRKYNVSIKEPLRRALINVGRYKHGARSMEALIELMPPKKEPVEFYDIEDHPLLGMHVDRGPLDPKVIGGYIGLSGRDSENKDVREALYDSLFCEGAVLAVGSKFHSGGLPEELKDYIKKFPNRLEPDGKRLAVFVTPPKSEPPDEREDCIEVQKISEVGTEELRSKLPELSDEKRKDWKDALELFRMRYQLALLSVAQIAVGGSFPIPKKNAYVGYPGVVEELMLALLMKHPVYIVGYFNGGSKWAGVLLGLGRSWMGRPPGFDHDRLPIPRELEEDWLFRPPPFRDLPLTRDELVEFFESRALGGPGWVNNGLSAEENRELFDCDKPKRIASLVQSGLLAYFSQRMT